MNQSSTPPPGQPDGEPGSDSFVGAESADRSVALPAGGASGEDVGLGGVGPVGGPEQNLPPVEPPSASFLMQLFFIPLLIVTILISVWLSLNWLAHRGTRPSDLVEEIEKVDLFSWQRAHTLAEILNNSRRHADVRRNEKLAQRLADVLSRECALTIDSLSERERDERLQLRVYLSTALSLFETDVGLAELIRATESDQPVYVRTAAIEALAVRLGNVGSTSQHANERLLGTLLEAAVEGRDTAGNRDPRRRCTPLTCRLRPRCVGE